MKFERAYTAEELDAATDMVCHPCSLSENPPRTHLIRNLVRDPFSGRFVQTVPFGAWTDPEERIFPPISEGKNVEAGHPFPTHWLWNPYNGEKL